MYHSEHLSFCDKTLKFSGNDTASRLIFAHLNINSIRNKFELFKEQIKGNIDILTISKQKLTTPFLIVNFLLKFQYTV